jgi:RimJ/RimL family protein N-acetyltransferase
MTETRTENLMPPEIVIGQNLSLRQLVPGDAEALFAIIQSSPDIKSSVTWPASVDSIEDARAGIEQLLEENPYRYTLQEDSATIGYVGMYDSDVSDNAFGLGYFLAVEKRGRGITTTVLDQLMRSVKNNVPVDMFVAYIIDSNKPSQAVVSKLGFAATDILLKDKALQAMIRRWERPVHE